jgi:hypothetical protein
MTAELPPVVVANVCGTRPGDPNPLKATIYRWICPYCDGSGQWNEHGERCMNCHGYGLTNDTPGYEEHELTPAPRPPAVMRNPCVDCAYRPGSPEEDSTARPGPDVPFFCHHGLHRIGDGYVSTALLDDRIPLGAMLCAGWWALATGQPLPDRAFRDPGGSDRHPDAPESEPA